MEGGPVSGEAKGNFKKIGGGRDGDKFNDGSRYLSDEKHPPSDTISVDVLSRHEYTIPELVKEENEIWYKHMRRNDPNFNGEPFLIPVDYHLYEPSIIRALRELRVETGPDAVALRDLLVRLDGGLKLKKISFKLPPLPPKSMLDAFKQGSREIVL